MDICLALVHNLKKVNIKDVGFVYTEEHSRRVRVRVRIRGALRQRLETEAEAEGREASPKRPSFTFIDHFIRTRDARESGVLRPYDPRAPDASLVTRLLEFKVQNKQCEACQMAACNDFGDFTVQIRQRGSASREFFSRLQEDLAATDLCEELSIVNKVRNGIDMLWRTRQGAEKLIQYLVRIYAVRVQTTRKLVTHDEHTSYHRYKMAFSCEVAPIVASDLVLLHEKTFNRYRGLLRQPLLLCTRAGTSLQFIDPSSGKKVDLGGRALWQELPSVVASADSANKYIVLQIEQMRRRGQHASESSTVSEVTVMEYDGNVQREITVPSHIGDDLEAGDVVEGYPLTVGSPPLDTQLATRHEDHIPELVIFRKVIERS